MSGPQSLQGLCTVCYAEQPKYRCPRCKTQTCSLPCYKRHQQRASCNGQRSPAAFVKKSQWATPSGIDHDYNYLKSVERNIERAGEDVKALAGDSAKSKSRQWHAESSLQRYLQQHRIDVVRAPEGMSRSRINKTRVTQSGKIFWTIEWIDETGAFIDEDCPESSKLIDLYSAMTSKRQKARQALESAGEREPKRRRIEEVTDQALSEPEQPAAARPTEKAVDGDAGEASSSKTAELKSAVHLYLLRSGNSDAKVLIPLQVQDTLTTALRERSLQEFPTIYNLGYAEDELPSQYILEDTYLTASKSAQPTLVPGSNSAKHSAPTPSMQMPDAAQVLEMLRRDMHRT